MPAAKGGSKRRREPGRDKAWLLAPQAIRESWGSVKLAREAGISPDVARDVLAEASRMVVDKAGRELGVVGAELRGEAHKQRSAVLARLRVAGEQCDRLQARVGEILERLGESEKQSAAQELATLASACERAARASLACWQAFKDASGLALAERVAEAKAKAEAKATGKVRPWEVEVVEVPLSE